VLSIVFALGCSSSPDSKSGSSPESDSGPSVNDAGPGHLEASPGTSVEHGIMVDYETLTPVQGLTVTDNGLSATTDANGEWSLTVPQGASLQPTVTNGSSYSRLLFPDATAMASDIDFSTVVIPDSSTYGLEETVLTDMDTSKALVQVVVVTQPSCASAAGGTLSVTSPSGASLEYFEPTSASPSSSLTSFQTVKQGRPVAVVYNIDPSATLSLQVSHPTCKQVAFPVTYGGRQYTGTVRLSPAEPGHVNSAIVIVLE
jgi:hypothetical protein